MSRTFAMRTSYPKPVRDDEYGRRQRSSYHPRDPESETWADPFPTTDDTSYVITEDEDNHDTTPVNTNT